MIFVKRLLRLSPAARSGATISILKSLDIRLRASGFVARSSFKTRLFFFLRVAVITATAPFRLKKVKGKTVVLHNATDNPERRKFFYRKFSGEDVSDAQFLIASARGLRAPLYHTGMSRRKWALLFRISFALFGGAFRGLFRSTRLNYHWKLRASQMLYQQVLLQDPNVKQMLFHNYLPETYFSSFLAAELQPDYRPMMAASNSPWFSDNRYFHHPRAALRLCSRFQDVEIRAFAEKGWVKVGDIELWGLEESDLLDKVRPQAAAYEIGLYSSGFWARENLLYQSPNLEKVAAYAFADNPLYLLFKEILSELIAYTDSRGAKLKVYLHPYERKLLKKGIRPPYLDLLDEKGISFDLEAGNSLESIYECRVGVAIQSTIVFDRFHLGLNNLFYAGDAFPVSTVDLRFCGKYAGSAFASPSELAGKLDSILQ